MCFCSAHLWFWTNNLFSYVCIIKQNNSSHEMTPRMTQGSPSWPQRPRTAISPFFDHFSFHKENDITGYLNASCFLKRAEVHCTCQLFPATEDLAVFDLPDDSNDCKNAQNFHWHHGKTGAPFFMFKVAIWPWDTRRSLWRNFSNAVSLWGTGTHWWGPPTRQIIMASQRQR